MLPIATFVIFHSLLILWYIIEQMMEFNKVQKLSF